MWIPGESASFPPPVEQMAGMGAHRSLEEGEPATRRDLCAKIINRHRFENESHEKLFKRYIFHIQYTSVQVLLVLYITLTVALAILNFVFVSRISVENISNIALCVIYVVILVFLHTKYMKVNNLQLICYAILIVCLCFCVLSLPVNFQESPRGILTPAEGVWRVAFVILTVYAFLPFKLYVAIAFGILLPIIHSLVSIMVANFLPWLLWRQVSHCGSYKSLPSSECPSVCV